MFCSMKGKPGNKIDNTTRYKWEYAQNSFASLLIAQCRNKVKRTMVKEIQKIRRIKKAKKREDVMR